MAKYYDLKNVVCTIGATAVGGFGDSDAISVEWDSDLTEAKKMADGGTVYSRLNDRGMMVTFTLSQHSRAYPQLAAMLELQHGDNSGIPVPILAALPFFLTDISNGDSISSTDCVFMSRPAASKNKTAGDVTFKVHLPNPKIINGARNLT